MSSEMKHGSEQNRIERKKTGGTNQASRLARQRSLERDCKLDHGCCSPAGATRPAGEYFCGESEDERKKPSETAVCTAGAAACRPCPWRAWVRQERMDGPEPDDSAGACTHLDNPSSLRCRVQTGREETLCACAAAEMGNGE